MALKQNLHFRVSSFCLPPVASQAEPLLCKFADGGVKKRNQINKQGRGPQSATNWVTRPGEAGLTYENLYARNG